MALENLIIPAGHNIPEIRFIASTGELNLIGKCIPENATRFFNPIVQWITEYLKDPYEETNLHLDLLYFNTGSSIWIARMIKLLSTINNHDRLLIIHLYFDLEEYEEMEDQELDDALSPITDVLHEATVSIGVKIYGKDNNDSVLKEKFILF